MRHRLFIPAVLALLFALAACTQNELADDSRLSKEEYPAILTMPEGALLAGNNYTYTVKMSNKVLEVSEATIAKWNDIDGGEVDADL